LTSGVKAPLSFVVPLRLPHDRFQYMLFLVILLTSALSLVATWIGTGGLVSGGGNPVVSVLVGFIVALLWARDFENLERSYLLGQSDSLRRKMKLWSSSMGKEEALLVRLSVEVELNRPVDVQRVIEEADALGLSTFARAWSAGMTARLSGENRRAVVAFAEGAEACNGLDRAELLCEASMTLLQLLPYRPAEERASDLQRAIDYSMEAGRLTRDGGYQNRHRGQYLNTFQRGLVGVIQVAQQRFGNADRHLASVSDRARLLPSLRARRLAWALRIERLSAIRRTGGEAAMDHEFDAIRRRVGLASLRLRMHEIAEQRRNEAVEETKTPAKGGKRQVRPSPARPAAGENDDDQIKISIPFSI
jgi:hypothetical protein